MDKINCQRNIIVFSSSLGPTNIKPRLAVPVTLHAYLLGTSGGGSCRISVKKNSDGKSKLDRYNTMLYRVSR
ncbi:hypothetical protein RRG08_042251 [Elysia crispata]|uniref:Uncharacterized protein n=1 Tax=Elysia crispata TaxID=231223 RepID=A0AAE1AT67_9GAST|nr:hypothetical protein RRG08_042251 [Elysia crispata]